MPLNTELVATLLQPVADTAPSGADLRYDPRINAIKEARREVVPTPAEREAGDGGKVADWTSVLSTTTQMLSKETKDLQLAAWLTEALLRRNGISGLATGVEAVRGMLDKYWDTLYPPIEDDDLELRIGPIEWIGSKLAVSVRLAPLFAEELSYATYNDSRGIPTEADGAENKEKRLERAEALSQGKIAPEDADRAIEATSKAAVKSILADTDAAIAAVNALEKASDEKFGGDAPSLGPLRNALEDAKRLINSVLARKLELDPDPIEETPVAEEQMAVGADGAPISVEPLNRNDANNRIAVIARWLRQQDPSNPAPYAMLRGYRWGELRAAAPDLDPKLLEAPPTAVRSRLKGLLIDGRWPELLEAGEALMATAQGRAWLDLQRYSLTACTNLGGGYDAVAAVIRSELRALLSALPTLPKMTLMDDTPTANSETREWLEAESLQSSEQPAAEAQDATAGEDVEASDGAENLESALEEDASTSENGGFVRARKRSQSSRNGHRDVFDLARNELAGGRPNRAIEMLVTELSRERSPRGRFVRQTQIAVVMVEGGFEAVAKPILDKLLETIDERGLEQWESGPLVAQPLALLVRVHDKLELDADARHELYLRVCRLDPLQAMALTR
jgi:type VI secretion system protein ImpA